MDHSFLVPLPRLLLPWYYAHKRDLPWRADRDPYHIWLSEIMLQQTRVEAVRGYYTRCLAALPTIEALASCEDELLHKLWEGLGYYSRVRNLKKAAGQIMEHHNGVFPKNYRDILALPGIGEYTAGSICSIAYDFPTPAVDGNVLRVVSRLMDDHTPIDTPAFKEKTRLILAEIYPDAAGDFTQALMELGATVCGPNKRPECDQCPCIDICQGYQKSTTEMLPVKSPKRGKRQEDKTLFIFSCDGKFALEKRPSKGLLAGLWQFPNVNGKLNVQDALVQAEAMGLPPRQILRQLEKKHIFTHIQWNMRAFYLETTETAGSFQWFTAEEINAQAALPTAFRQFWEETGHV